METLYMGCLVLGVIFALVSLLLGDVIGNAIDGMFDFSSVHMFNPTVIAGGVTVFGGAGLLLTRYTEIGNGAVTVLSLLTAAFMAMLVYLGFVKPMDRSEMSTGFSMRELPGRIAVVTVPLPAAGYGEVMISFGAGNSLHTAASFDRNPIPAGVRVVVVEVKEGVAMVSELDDRKGDEA
ncbi:protease [Paenibacillus sp. CN-4]|uniref:protease n=1 Tax=Paenibacillus nanchangensis TaxID=3348343 RepID=UPI00397D6210